MKAKLIVYLLPTVILTTFALADAQQTKKISRIGYLSAGIGSLSSYAPREPFRQGLREIGYVEGQNIAFDYRYTGGKSDRLPEFAAELVRLKVDIILVAVGPIPIQAAKNATKTIPIVMVGSPSDPVEAGLVESLCASRRQRHRPYKP